MEGRAIPTSTSPLLRFRESYGYVAGFRTRSNLVYRLTSAAALNSPAGALAKTRDPQQETSQIPRTRGSRTALAPGTSPEIPSNQLVSQKTKEKNTGIETSCDETAAGLVDQDGRLLANVVASQSELHARFGGVVPEVASRQHLLSIQGVLRRALDESGTEWEDIDAVAVTNGPGLAGALIVGVNVAKGLAASLGVPLVGVNHLAGHVYAAWIAGHGPVTPRMCLIVSGGHTELVLMDEEGRFRMIGETRDDAAGEAFDKVARVLGLRYPGGPEIQRAARDGGRTESLPRAWLRGTHDFSFSGLKTAVIRRPEGPPWENVAALAREFQNSVVDVLVKKTVDASARYGCGEVVLAGGVAATRRSGKPWPAPRTCPLPCLPWRCAQTTAP
ncbi:tRNA N6-adenosine threonylcarbamoyltransferase [Geodia barretti]|uniref:N(6)-L-threonylcarbamoyladenine synthase n=1 Tax=Geodia barretti TaxID=519541 RepID=A0AA35X066_GEOBA|nr:tRNA N6-adenosine threonylcarbamoyltransferase [Geodia barretti]